MNLPRPRSMRWIEVAVLLAVALAVGLWWAFRPGPRVAFLGDSITVVSAPELTAALGSDYTPDISAVLGIQAGQTTAAKNPSQVVIDLGSNDVIHDAPLGQAATDLTRLVGLFPHARCIHLVNVNMDSAGKPVLAKAGLLNAAIAHLNGTDPWISIIDWNQISPPTSQPTHPWAPSPPTPSTRTPLDAPSSPKPSRPHSTNARHDWGERAWARQLIRQPTGVHHEIKD